MLSEKNELNNSVSNSGESRDELAKLHFKNLNH